MGGPAWVGQKQLASTSNFLVAPTTIECAVVDEAGEPRNRSHKPHGIEWRTCEHFFQAAKFDSGAGMSTWEQCRKIQQAKSPLYAWELGQSRTHRLRQDWDTVKANAMYIAVRAKYDQYPEYASELAASTEPIRAGPSTSNWQKLNSIVLERVRYELRQNAGFQPLVDSKEYKEWCNMTNLPSTSKPVIVYLAGTSSEPNPQTSNHPDQTAPACTAGEGNKKVEISDLDMMV